MNYEGNENIQSVMNKCFKGIIRYKELVKMTNNLDKGILGNCTLRTRPFLFEIF